MTTRSSPLPIYRAFVVCLGATATALAASSLIAGAAVLYFSVTSGSTAELKRRAEFAGAMIAESVDRDFRQGDISGARQTMRRMVTGGLGVAAVRLLDRYREPLLTYGELPSNRGFESADVPVYEGLLTWPPDAKAKPRGYVRVFVAGEPWDPERISRYANEVGCLAFVSLLLGVVAYWALSRLATPLGQVEQELQSMAEFGLNDEKPALRSGGLGAMVDAIRSLRHGMQFARLEQADIIESRTRDLQAAVASATRSNEEKKRLLAYGDEAVEAERKRIAGEIHDTVGSMLVSLRLRAEAIATRASGTEQDEIRGMAESIVRTTNQLYDSTRTIVQMLRPELLEALGLTGAVAELVHRLNESQQACRFEYYVQDDTIPVRGVLAITLYRVAQEAFTNVLKHARASSVSVAIGNAEPPRQLRLVIADDGKGLRAGRNPSGSGLGLIAMRERVEANGGVLSIASDANGTTITVAL